MIVLVGHGDLPEAFKRTMELVVGDVDSIRTVCLNPEKGEEGLERQFTALEKEIDEEHVTILADIAGGSPCNTALARFGERKNVDIITGMNMPMIITAFFEGKAGNSLVKESRKAIFDATSLLAEQGADEPEAVSNRQIKKAVAAKLPYNASNPHSIVGVRVDSRGVHGQVATAWIPFSGASRVMIIDDAIIDNSMQKAALRLARPEGVKLSILSSKTAAQRLLDKGNYPGEKIFVVLTDVSTLARLGDEGLYFDEVNMGNVPKRPETKEYCKTVRLTDGEVEIIRSLIDKGTHFTSSLLPKDARENFNEKIMK